ncbi:hypothetical protein TSAR_011679 [Trichomalopsis sarcophagae]|uniref:Uncharacterized protein n=1 Tax=Trichomalopsis sarcophagae TaxID=543379 RepID=A0A232EDR6_9HYME|nr:hypothetical protein TSAR_011679 [Trichomalopsis sarcophagae]
MPTEVVIGTKFMKDSNSTFVTNVIQYDLWKKYKSSNGKFLIPIFVYHDELGNALGSHAGTNKMIENILTIMLYFNH